MNNKNFFYETSLNLNNDQVKFNIQYENNRVNSIKIGKNILQLRVTDSLVNHGYYYEIIDDEQWLSNNLLKITDVLSIKEGHNIIWNNQSINYRWDTIKNKAFYRENQGKSIASFLKSVNECTLIGQNIEYLHQLLMNILESLWSYNFKSNDEIKTFKLNIFTNNNEKFFQQLPSIIHRVESIFLCKYLGITPPNILYPTNYSKFIKEHFKNTSVTVEIFGEASMKAMGMGALLSIGQGSPRESQMVVMKYGHGAKLINFIGKGITFDTGGSNLKLGHFADMKYDMMGSATVVAIMDLLSKNLQLMEQFTFVGVVGLVENQIGGHAVLPSDIVTNIDGKTIEILNTDAEGRVILSDLIGYSKKYFKEQWKKNPDNMIIFATLTGSIVECLSDTYSGLFSNNNTLAHKFMALGDETGDLCWMMPCNEYYNYVTENNVADIGNIHSRKGGGAIKGAKFLEFFIGKNIDFAYFDIAGVADCIGRLNSDYHPTGWGIKLIDSWIKNI